jgi:hypothetical protein
MLLRLAFRIAALSAALVCAAHAGEWPYFVTYSHQMEEPGNLEAGFRSALLKPDAGHRFLGTAFEFEYGVTRRWTTEVYIDGQKTAREAAFFTGFRWENRVQLLKNEHWINPVLYVEYEQLNGADKSLLEVVGHDGLADLIEPVAEVRGERKREIEAKLILGSHVKGWNISENFIAEKNLAHEPFEFGYAVAASRPLSRNEGHCAFCARTTRVGVEMYGGLGTHDAFGFRGTSQYVAPTFGFQISENTWAKVSTGFGITDTSAPFLLRFGVTYEINGFGSYFHR